MPVPNPPGIAAVPPFAMGNRVSKIRCPVTKSRSAGYRFWMGLGMRIGHRCAMVSSFSSPERVRMTASGSSMVYCPSPAARTTVPSRSGGTMTLWRMAGVSGTSAITMPPDSTSPSFTTTFVSHFFSRSSRSTLTPLGIYAPDCCPISCRGRSIPSKIFVIIPGARVTQRSRPAPSTRSPGFSPVVSSNTWMVVCSLVSPMTSPTRRCSPT